MPPVAWLDLAAADLTARQLHDVLQLRNRVFVVEQECAYLDIDGRDLAPTTRHLLGFAPRGSGTEPNPGAEVASGGWAGGGWAGGDGADQLVAVSRLLPGGAPHEHRPDSGPGNLRHDQHDADTPVWIGRIVVTPEHRGTGLGREVVQRSLNACTAHWPGRPVQLAAQAHLRHFYASFGFEVASSPYDEDGIPHLDMRRA